MSKRKITLKQFCKLFIEETPIYVVKPDEGIYNESAVCIANWEDANSKFVDYCYRFNGNIYVALEW